MSDINRGSAAISSLRPLPGLSHYIELDAEVIRNLVDRGGGYSPDVAGHLEDGAMMTAPMESTQCLLDAGHNLISGGPSLLADGTWYWRLDAVHYVRAHQVWLPDAFIAHVARLDFKVPALTEDEVEGLYWELVEELRDQE